MPAKTTSFILGDHFDQFVGTQLQTGRYGSVSEVIRAALRMMEDYERKVIAFEAAIDAGDRSGIAEGDPVARVRQRLGLEPR